MAGSHNTARIIGVVGASGSGKSRWLKSVLDRGNPPRLLIWDPLGEYDQGEVMTDLREVVEAVVTAGSDGPFRIVYRPGKRKKTYPDKFDTLCELVFAAGNLCLVVEELADVTGPSPAETPDSWSVLSRQGRHEALTIFGVTQRPALIDKTFLGNCTMIHCSRLNDENDVRTMSRYLAVSQDQVRAMVADKDAGRFDFIERDMQTGKTVSGVLPSLGSNTPKPVRNVRTLAEPAPNVT
ncbi:Helicase HerA central domain-containing protein [Cupriavidus necator]|uniref:Helicase HerA central domain-containing protein n=1 Tax=Cupriavidus necator (strain ATCC 17699 / DSM 428 / KCTC 22496 / NCIMB 10442 / H16 / Stanier 337) TaxID=381666 RepID=Q0K1L2_CUPNH|nr:ATP-binding protein [Cupriavidus necator]QQB81036.1 ATP-binding protein [Cupriavidus necator]WKA42871.1 ATP-binding protein [Cupriavidus necator]CAJ96112.1 Hypothetical protein H16_B1322 [Cupriavidus necator H16]